MSSEMNDSNFDSETEEETEEEIEAGDELGRDEKEIEIRESADNEDENDEKLNSEEKEVELEEDTKSIKSDLEGEDVSEIGDNANIADVSDNQLPGEVIDEEEEKEKVKEIEAETGHHESNNHVKDFFDFLHGINENDSIDNLDDEEANYVREGMDKWGMEMDEEEEVDLKFFDETDSENELEIDDEVQKIEEEEDELAVQEKIEDIIDVENENQGGENGEEGEEAEEEGLLDGLEMDEKATSAETNVEGDDIGSERLGNEEKLVVVDEGDETNKRDEIEEEEEINKNEVNNETDFKEEKEEEEDEETIEVGEDENDWKHRTRHYYKDKEDQIVPVDVQEIPNVEFEVVKSKEEIKQERREKRKKFWKEKGLPFLQDLTIPQQKINLNFSPEALRRLLRDFGNGFEDLMKKWASFVKETNAPQMKSEDIELESHRVKAELEKFGLEWYETNGFVDRINPEGKSESQHWLEVNKRRLIEAQKKAIGLVTDTGKDGDVRFRRSVIQGLVDISDEEFSESKFIDEKELRITVPDELKKEVVYDAKSLFEGMRDPERRKELIDYAKLPTHELSPDTIAEMKAYKESGAEGPILNRRVIVNIQTTGQNVEKDAIYQMSVYMEDTLKNEVKKELCCFLRDERKNIEETITKIDETRRDLCNIPKKEKSPEIEEIVEMVRNAPPLSKYLATLNELLSNYEVTGYNYDNFGRLFLENAGVVSKYPGIDILSLVRKRRGGRKLENAFNEIVLNKPKGFIDLKETHLAGVDCLMETVLMNGLFKEREGIIEKQKKEAEKEANPKKKYYYLDPPEQWDKIYEVMEEKYGITEFLDIKKELGFNHGPSKHNGSAINEYNKKLLEDKTGLRLKWGEKTKTKMEKTHDEKWQVNYYQAQIGVDILRKNGWKIGAISSRIDSKVDYLLNENTLLLPESYKKFVELVQKYEPNFVLYGREYYYSISRDPNLDHKHFEKMAELHKFFDLGLLMSDGNVYITKSGHGRVSLELNLNQEPLVLNFTKSIGADIRSIKRDYNRNTCAITVSSTKIAKDLIVLGCDRAKSKILEFPHGLFSGKDANSKKLLFVLGYFFGDGTKCTSEITSGSKNFLDGVQKALNITNPVRERTRELGTTYNLSLGSKIMRKMLDLADNISGIPGTIEFPQKTLYKPNENKSKDERMSIRDKIITILYELKESQTYYHIAKICFNTTRKSNFLTLNNELDELIKENVVIKQPKPGIMENNGKESNYLYKINPDLLIEVYPEEIRDYEETRMFIPKEECENIIENLRDGRSQEETIQWISESIGADFKRTAEKTFYLEKDEFQKLRELYGIPIIHTEYLSVNKIAHPQFKEAYFHEFSEGDKEKAEVFGIFFAAGSVKAPGNGYICHRHFISMSKNINPVIIKEFLEKTYANMQMIDITQGFSISCKPMAQDFIKHGFSADPFKNSIYPSEVLNPKKTKDPSELDYYFLKGYYRVKGYAGVITDTNKKMLNQFCRHFKLNRYHNVEFHRAENVENSYYTVKLPENVLNKIGINEKQDVKKILNLVTKKRTFDYIHKRIASDKRTLTHVLKKLESDNEIMSVKSKTKGSPTYQYIPEKNFEEPHTEQPDWVSRFDLLTDKYIFDRIWKDGRVSGFAKELGVSSNTVTDRCHKRLILTPPGGFHRMPLGKKNKIKRHFKKISDCLNKNKEIFLSKQEISEETGVPISFLENWIDKTPINNTIVRNLSDGYRLRERQKVTTIDEKRNQNDSMALSNIVLKMKELNRSVSAYELGKGKNKVPHGDRTIKRTLERGIKEGLIKRVRKGDRSKYELI